MGNFLRTSGRRAMIISILLLIALAHIFGIGRHFQGAFFILFQSYFSDIVLPFGFYLLLGVDEQWIPVLKRWEVKLALMFLIPSIAETCQYFGIPVLGSTFDPLDYLMYAIGVTLAAIVDTQVFPRITGKHFTGWAILLILLTACSGITTAAPATPAQTAPLLASPTEDLKGLSVEDAATLRSLEKVDDYPLFVMHYSGGYTYPQTGLRWPPEHDFACSLFVTLAQPGNMLYGRNFDWDFSPALLLFTDPPDGYASVSMVDLTFLGIRPDTAAELTSLPLAQRIGLLNAPSMPFDGMNEYGLAIAMAAVPETGANGGGYDPAKPTIGSIGIIRQILDHARTVEEAVKQFEQYNIDFAGGPPIHYLIADTSGKAALIELYEGRLVVLPNVKPWHLATNHLRCAATGDGGCQRYHTLSEQLAAANGLMDEQAAMQLLADVAQGSTQWSAVYNLRSGEVSVVMGQSYGDAFHFHLDQVNP